MMKKKTVRLISGAVAGILVGAMLVSVVASGIVYAGAASSAELKDKLSSLEDQKAEIKKELDSTASKVSDVEKTRAALQKEITLTKEEIEKDFDAFVKLFTWNYLQKYFIKQDNLTVTPEEATAEAKALAQAQFAQYGLPTAPEDMLANYAKKILEDREQGQKIYEKLYEMKVVEDVKSKIKVTEKAVSAEEFAKLAKEI